MRDVARPLRRGPPRPRPGRRGRDGAARLGRLRHLLPLSAGALAAPADEQPAGVGLQWGAAADQCDQADAPPRRRALPGLQAGRAAESELAGAEWGCELDDVGVGALRVQRRPAAGAAQPRTDRHSRMINGRRGREFPQLLRLPHPVRNNGFRKCDRVRLRHRRRVDHHAMTMIGGEVQDSGAGAASERAGPQALRLDEPSGRWVVAAAVLGSGIAAVDATVVNIALPALGSDLQAGFSGLQWTINGYTLTLAALILLGGSLGDRYGRRRIFVIGVTWFALASLLCGLAPNLPTLVAARMLQGVGGALLTPGSLAIMQASFVAGDRARAVGAWSGLGGIAAAVGPFVGGWLLEVTWRLVFLVNIPMAALVLAVAARHLPETRDPGATGRFDISGAVLGAVGLAGLTGALVRAGDVGWTGGTLAALGTGLLGLAAFVLWERR